MKLVIQRVGDSIATVCDFKDVSEPGEISHIICEIELAKRKLLDMWEKTTA